jgi:hypothetical protein
VKDADIKLNREDAAKIKRTLKEENPDLSVEEV